VALLERRIGLLFAAFLALLLLAGGRALFLGTIKGSSLASAAANQQVSSLELPARRGTIVDRNGSELAVSEPADDVSATPYLVKDPVKTAARLAPLLGKSEDDLVRALARRDTGFVYLARALPANQAARGESIEIRDTKPAKPGARLELTIDSAIQSKVEQVLGQVGQQYRPKGATAVVMNPATGEVLALANWPVVDANDPSSAPSYALQNRAVGYTYEPGSTFKSITVAGALQDGTVTPSTPFDLPPQIQVADRTIGESHPRGPVTLTTAQILAQSSNVGAIKIGLEMGGRSFDSWVRRFGFGKPTGVDLPGEERGIVPTY